MRLQFNGHRFLVNDYYNSYVNSFSATNESNLSTTYEDAAQNITNDYITVQNNEQSISSLTTSVGQYHQTSPQHVADEPNDSTPAMHTEHISVPKIFMTFDSSQNQIVKFEFAGVEIVIKQKLPSVSNQYDQHQQKNRNHSSILSANRTANRMHPYRKSIEQNFLDRNDNNDTCSSTPVQLNAIYQNDRSGIATDNPQPQFQGSFDNFRD